MKIVRAFTTTAEDAEDLTQEILLQIEKNIVLTPAMFLVKAIRP
jgi:hypothetical protein